MNQMMEITRYLREPIIIIEWILIFVFLEGGILAFYRYLNKGKFKRSIYELVFSFVFLSIAFNLIFTIIADFHLSLSDQKRTIFFVSGIVNLSSSILIIILSIKQGNMLFQHVSIGLLAVLILIFGLSTYVHTDIIYSQSILFIAGYMGFFLIFFNYLIKRYGLKSLERFFRVGISIGFLFLIVGHLLTNPLFFGNNDLEIRLLGDMILLAGVILTSYPVLKIPPLVELLWKDKLDSLFIMDSSGVCLYYYYFNKPKTEIHESLITGAIMTIRIILDEITEEKGVSTIKKEEGTTIIYPGKKLFGVIICQEDLSAPKVLIKDLIDKVELIYEPILENWDGELDVFNPIELIVQDIFT